MIEVDYLVVGAGTAGMAITDELLAHSDATVAIVDRRPAPGGHWLEAYPFVRLHQPSAFYGVSSLALESSDAIDRSGFNEGFAALAGADELRAYFARVMRQTFLPSGRVQYFACSDHLGGDAGGHTFVSRLTGERHQVRVRR
jgi:cation diffusion facilitator CzcD-associated flavoprotein CzcO